MIGFMKLPEIRGMDKDSPEANVVWRGIIKRKKMLRMIYTDFYKEFSEISGKTGDGLLVEIGSGAGFLKEVIPKVKLSDIYYLPWLDTVFSAEKMPFSDQSVSAFFMLDVLHHIPHPERFFREAERCLKPGGKIVMIEPFMSWWGKFIWKFHGEPCNEKSGWDIPERGPLSGANSAIPCIIFRRDRALFEKKFPQLKIIKIEPHNQFSYLLSGGLSMKAMVPASAYGLLKKVERLLKPLSNQLSMFVTIALEKE